MECGVDVEDGDVMPDTPGPPAQWGSILLETLFVGLVPCGLGWARDVSQDTTNTVSVVLAEDLEEDNVPWLESLDLALELTGQPESSLTDVYSKGTWYKL